MKSLFEDPNLKITAFIFLSIFGTFSYWGFFGHNAVEWDIYYIFHDGERLINGENPYSRVLESNMRDNNKYSTYFPMFYLICAGMQYLGLDEFGEWLIVWRSMNLVVVILVSWIIFTQVYDRVGVLAALFGGVFWQLHTFTLGVMSIAHIDFLAILFLLWSLIYMEKNQKVSLILFGISLSIKHIGIFLAPFYLFYCYEQIRDWKKTLYYCTVYAGLAPFLVSLPFLIWDAEGLIKSILFSATRNLQTHFPTPTLVSVYRLEGIPARIPMAVLMLIPSILYFQGKLGKYFTCFLVFSVFTGFSAVIFRQYMVWPLVFVPLMMGEFQFKKE